VPQIMLGDNVERRLGRARFLFFYLACGIAAGLAHILFNSRSAMPTVGASGAISGVLGGYLLLFPQNRVRVMTSGGIRARRARVVARERPICATNRRRHAASTRGSRVRVMRAMIGW